MKDWMNRNRIVRFAVDAAETKRILAGLLSALVLLAAGPASAFEATTEADGSTTYFFGTPSLRIESAGALDLSGLRRIETFADGRILSAAGTPGVVQGAVLTIGGRDDPRNPAGSVGSGGTLVILPGADIDLSGSGPDTGQITLVPEPQTWLLLAAGLALMQIFRRRGGAHATGSA